MLVNAEKKDSVLLLDSPVPHEALAEAGRKNGLRLARVPTGGADQSWNYGDRSWIPAGGRPRGFLQLPFVVSTVVS
jgi:hypothetical protein